MSLAETFYHYQVQVSTMSSELIILRFGEKLRALRERHGMSQTALAQALGHSAHGYISELEAGKKLPTLEFVLKASRYFGISMDCLVKDELELDHPETRSTGDRL